MAKQKPNRRTTALHVQMDPEVAAAVRDFALKRGQKLRIVLEQAIRRHLANPPPELDIPPLPPVGMRSTK